MAGLVAAEGSIKPGHNVIPFLFWPASGQELPGELSILDTVYHTAVDMTITQVRSLLGAFRYPATRWKSRFGCCRAGEKSRVAWPGVGAAGQLMLLDERNHLDAGSQEISRRPWPSTSTIIVVSHTTVSSSTPLSTRFWRPKQQPSADGNIEDYLEWRRKADAQSASRRAIVPRRGGAPA